MWEIHCTVSRILHVFDPALPHFTQTLWQAVPLIDGPRGEGFLNWGIIVMGKSGSG